MLAYTAAFRFSVMVRGLPGRRLDAVELQIRGLLASGCSDRVAFTFTLPAKKIVACTPASTVIVLVISPSTQIDTLLGRIVPPGNGIALERERPADAAEMVKR